MYWIFLQLQMQWSTYTTKWIIFDSSLYPIVRIIMASFPVLVEFPGDILRLIILGKFPKIFYFQFPLEAFVHKGSEPREQELWWKRCPFFRTLVRWMEFDWNLGHSWVGAAWECNVDSSQRIIYEVTHRNYSQQAIVRIWKYVVATLRKRQVKDIQLEMDNSIIFN